MRKKLTPEQQRKAERNRTTRRDTERSGTTDDLMHTDPHSDFSGYSTGCDTTSTDTTSGGCDTNGW